MDTGEPVGRNDGDGRASSDTTESTFVDEPGAGVSRWVALGLALALVVWMASPLLLPAPPSTPAPLPELKPVTVAVRESAAERIPRLFIADGVARPNRRTALRAEMSGVIEAVEARKGDIVEAGALLARFRSARLEAEYARAREELAQATRDLENAQSLGDRGAVPANQVIQAQTALAGARATEAEARLARANAEIRAPFAGVLDNFDLEAGEYVTLGAEVGLLLDTDPLTVAFEVPLQAFAALALGQEAQIAFLTGQRATGALTFVGAHASAASRTFPAEVSVPNADGVIPSGVSARVTIATSETMAHLIAASTLTLGADGSLGVKTVDHADQVAFHPVIIERGEHGGLWVSGLADTARIITIGQTDVADGETVAPPPDARGLAEILEP
jgi:multidrug efflux system membrane fusion protein